MPVHKAENCYVSERSLVVFLHVMRVEQIRDKLQTVCVGNVRLHADYFGGCDFKVAE